MLEKKQKKGIAYTYNMDSTTIKQVLLAKYMGITIIVMSYRPSTLEL